LKDDPDVYVIGNSVGVVSPNFNFYPKAGHVANAHPKIVAKYISERVKGRGALQVLGQRQGHHSGSGRRQSAA
jgi:NADH dehydrogenase FAD-containing subunit